MKKKEFTTRDTLILVFIVGFILLYFLGLGFAKAFFENDNIWVKGLLFTVPGWIILTFVFVFFLILTHQKIKNQKEQSKKEKYLFDSVTRNSIFACAMNITKDNVYVETFHDEGKCGPVENGISTDCTIDYFFSFCASFFECERLYEINAALLKKKFEEGNNDYHFVSYIKVAGKPIATAHRIDFYKDEKTNELIGVLTVKDITVSYETHAMEEISRMDEFLLSLLSVNYDAVIEINLEHDSWEYKNFMGNYAPLEAVRDCHSYDDANETFTRTLPSPYDSIAREMTSLQALTNGFVANHIISTFNIPTDKLCTKWNEVTIFCIPVSGHRYCYLLSKNITKKMEEKKKNEQTEVSLKQHLRREVAYEKMIREKSFVFFNFNLTANSVSDEIYVSDANKDFDAAELRRKVHLPIRYTDLFDLLDGYVSENTKTDFAKIGLKNLIEDYENSRNFSEYDVSIRGKNNEPIDIHCQLMLYENEETGEILGTFSGRDVSNERKNSELQKETLINALNEAKEASKSKSSFLSNMSHDIRTPLNAIVGVTGIAKEHMDDQEKVKDCLEKIEVSSSHLLSLVNEVLDMSRIESGKTQLDSAETHLPDLIEELRTMSFAQAESKRVNLSFIQKSIIYPDVLIDGSRINNAVINIVNNAVKYTPAKGNVTVTVSQNMSLIKGNVKLIYVVEDNGIGMSEEFQQKLFVPFERENNTTKSRVEGTGLGLAIAKANIDLMNGKIDVKSKLGVGTTFTITVDVKVVEKQKEPMRKEDTLKAIRGLNFLIVEDNLINQMVIGEILKDKGANVITLGDGDEFVDYMKHVKEGDVDFVLCDIQMPKMNGWDATKAVRAMDNPICRKIPILALSANAFQEDVDKSISSGMNDHISKPVMIDALLEKISKYL